MIKLRRALRPLTCGPRALVIFLLLAGGALIGVQRADAKPAVALDDGIISAGTWLKNRLAPETTDVLMHFSAPNRGLTNYVTESIITITANRGINIKVQTIGDLRDSAVETFGWVVDAQSVVVGAITPLGKEEYQLELRIIDVGTHKDIARYQTTIKMDSDFMALLHNRPPDSAVTGKNTKTKTGEKENDFSAGRRAAAAAMNPLFGLGSYLMGDLSGGLFVSTGYALAGGSILWDVFGLKYENSDDYKYQIAGIPGLIGLGIAGGTTIFAILRPIFYQKSGFSRGEFSIGSRIGMAALNPLLGMGSYIMGDWVGGLIQSGGYALTLGLMAWDISGIDYESKDDSGYKFAGIPGLVGLGVAGATVVFGIIRPLLYHRTSSSNKAAEALKGVNIAFVPSASPRASGMTVHLGYSFHY
ncbi:hypothetical protein FACS189476_03430 [Spirochaetia bacterium]|nr:hypothetical protein FACS189476_03430 [Spirochaetia bacterium]